MIVTDAPPPEDPAATRPGPPDEPVQGAQPIDPGQTSRLPPIRRHDEFYSPDTSEHSTASGNVGYPQNPETTQYPTYQPPAYQAPPAQPAYVYDNQVGAVVPSMNDSDGDDVVIARGGGTAAVLGVGGLATAAIGLFALPVQQEPGRAEVFFGQLRSGAAYDRVSILTGASSNSLAGGSIATTFWRYGALGIVGGLAALLILTLAWNPTRRTGGALVFFGGVGALVYMGIAAAQTNKYATVLRDARATRIDWADWKIGFWVGAGGILIASVGGLIALTSRRPSEDE